MRTGLFCVTYVAVYSYQQENQDSRNHNILILFIQCRRISPVLLHDITDSGKHTVPYGDADERGYEIGNEFHSRYPGDEGDIGAAERDDTSDGNGIGSVAVEFLPGSGERFFCLGETLCDTVKNRSAAVSSHRIADTGAYDTGEGTEENQSKVRRAGSGC